MSSWGTWRLPRNRRQSLRGFAMLKRIHMTVGWSWPHATAQRRPELVLQRQPRKVEPAAERLACPPRVDHVLHPEPLRCSERCAEKAQIGLNLLTALHRVGRA